MAVLVVVHQSRIEGGGDSDGTTVSNYCCEVVSVVMIKASGLFVTVLVAVDNAAQYSI